MYLATTGVDVFVTTIASGVLAAQQCNLYFSQTEDAK